MSSEKPRFYGLQILRGLAAVLVLFHHEILIVQDRIPGAPWSPLLFHGAFGVDLFFPISGFVMFLTASSLRRRPHAADRLLWREFAWRRIVRIVPFYWVCTTLKLVLFVVAPAIMLHFTFLPWNVAASYLFLPAFDHNLQPEPVIPVGWTLNAEMFFYAIVTLALALRAPLLRFVGVTILALSLAGFVLSYPASHPWQALAYWCNPIALEFVAGLCLGACFHRLPKVSLWVAPTVFALALTFALLVPIPRVFTFVPQRVFFWGIPGTLIVWSVLSLETRLSLQHRRFLLLLGDASFSLYLIQTFTVPAIGYLCSKAHLSGMFGLFTLLAVSTVGSIGISILVHLYVELPLLTSLSRWSPPWSARSAATA